MRRALLALLIAAVVTGCGSGDDVKPSAPPPAPSPPVAVEVRDLPLRSDAVDRSLEAKVLAPRERRDGAPLLVLLHGQGSSPESLITPQLTDELERLGDRAPVVLMPDGDEASYWHDREGGDWARMVVDEAIPAAAERYGADPRKVSVGGISMGGFGALHLARSRRGRFCSVSAHSPAIFPTRPRQGTPFAEAFDDDTDFARVDLIRQARELPRGVWVDVGDADPFAPAVRRLVARMPEPRYREWSGGHEFSFVVKQTRTWLRFHLERLDRC